MSLDMTGVFSFRSLSESLFLNAIDPVTRRTAHSRSNSSDLFLIPHHLVLVRVALSATHGLGRLPKKSPSYID